MFLARAATSQPCGAMFLPPSRRVRSSAGQDSLRKLQCRGFAGQDSFHELRFRRSAGQFGSGRLRFRGLRGEGPRCGAQIGRSERERGAWAVRRLVAGALRPRSAKWLACPRPRPRRGLGQAPQRRRVGGEDRGGVQRHPVVDGGRDPPLAHHRVGIHIHGEDLPDLQDAIPNPVLAVLAVLAGQRIDSAQPGPAYRAVDQVDEAALDGIDQGVTSPVQNECLPGGWSASTAVRRRLH